MVIHGISGRFLRYTYQMEELNARMNKKNTL